MEDKTEINFFDKFHLGEGKLSKGKILLSEPFSTDDFFARSVVLLVEHSEEGSLGFVLNKKSEVVFNEVVKEFPKFESDILLGGPVEKNKLYYIHTLGKLLSGSEQIADDLYWGGDFEQLKALVNNKQITTNQIKFFAGYSGWAAGQLETEMKHKSWLITSLSLHQIMKIKNASMWKNILKQKGNQFTMMANFPENPTLN